ncbi:hypothetical protein KM043_000714 [Ampulex compressa]|nr:hypothetical protein KM043_000714 [Ampulex compressa]
MPTLCKVYLTKGKEPQNVEIRKIRLDLTSITLEDLHSELRNIFKVLKDVPFTVSWLDADNDRIAMSTDEELRLCIQDFQIPKNLKLYITLDSENNLRGSKMHHPGVICDACDNDIIGFRYKCIECDDYDLCSTCEALQHHSQHCMIRMPQPLKWSCRHGRRLSYHMRKFLKKNAFFNNMEGSTTSKCGSQSGCDHAIPIGFDALAKYFNAWTGLVTECPMMQSTAKEAGPSAGMETNSHAMDVEPEETTSTQQTSAKKFPGEADAPALASSNVADGWTMLNTSESPTTSHTCSSSSINEKCAKEPLSTTAGDVSPAKEAIYPQLTEEQKVFHPNPKIQEAVEAMMAMGFSNEGGWLTLLLDAKDGNISKVLDILQPVRQ